MCRRTLDVGARGTDGQNRGSKGQHSCAMQGRCISQVNSRTAELCLAKCCGCQEARRPPPLPAVGATARQHQQAAKIRAGRSQQSVVLYSN